MTALINIIGQRFGRLVVLHADPLSGTKNKRWVCRCDCGAEVSVFGFKLRGNITKSCGCYQEEIATALMKTADEERRLYTRNSYKAMIGRCHNPAYPAYVKYGAKGISVCDRWRFGEDGMTGWMCFFNDLGPKPSGHSIDRIDNTLGYTPENCRWATMQQQQENRRRVNSINKTVEQSSNPPPPNKL